jgi:hypothetical protein
MDQILRLSGECETWAFCAKKLQVPPFIFCIAFFKLIDAFQFYSKKIGLIKEKDGLVKNH